VDGPDCRHALSNGSRADRLALGARFQPSSESG
jgi:hypothetical protein